MGASDVAVAVLRLPLWWWSSASLMKKMELFLEELPSFYFVAFELAVGLNYSLEAGVLSTVVFLLIVAAFPLLLQPLGA